jgi:hypothetical protein
MAVSSPAAATRNQVEEGMPRKRSATIPAVAATAKGRRGA